ncbi:MAG: FMN-dependent NADH-azoreductase [Alphaproteobacteria bacterium]
MSQSRTLLRVDASMRSTGSVSRDLTDALVAKLSGGGGTEVVTRDLADGIDFVNEDWINANFTDPEERSADQKAALAASDALVAELKAADVIVMGVPIYNFGVPAALKAWIDMVSRARETFRYSEAGPVGMLEGKKAYLVVTSGGTEVESAIDHMTGYLKFVLAFLGITDVEIVAADKLMFEAETKIPAAREQIANIGV